MHSPPRFRREGVLEGGRGPLHGRSDLLSDGPGHKTTNNITRNDSTNAAVGFLQCRQTPQSNHIDYLLRVLPVQGPG